MLRRTICVIALLTIGISPISPVNPAVAQDGAPTNDYWWPNRLNLDPLRQTSRESNPLGDDFNYSEEFESLDIDALRISSTGLTTSTIRKSLKVSTSMR